MPRPVPAAAASSRGATPRGPGRPAGPTRQVRDAVLSAVRDELTEYGYVEFSIDRVAGRAGVHRSTVYKHWGGRTDLVKEAVVDWRRALRAPDDTGSWSQDLEALVRTAAAHMASRTTRALNRVLVVAQAVDPALVVAVGELSRRDDAALREVVVRAQTRGELDTTLDPVHVLELINGPLVLRTVMTGTPLDEGFLQMLIRSVRAATVPSPRGSGPPGPAVGRG